MSESVVDEPFACPNCGKSSDEHPTMDVSNAKTIFLCQDRAAKWQRVEPGTVIPAGQPYRLENGDEANEGVIKGHPAPGYKVPNYGQWFVDSSWKPLLVLPTEPTWGIAFISGRPPSLGKWRQALDLSGYQWFKDTSLAPGASMTALTGILDFIPLTDEQVARIEQAR